MRKDGTVIYVEAARQMRPFLKKGGKTIIKGQEGTVTPKLIKTYDNEGEPKWEYEYGDKKYTVRYTRYRCPGCYGIGVEGNINDIPEELRGFSFGFDDGEPLLERYKPETDISKFNKDHGYYIGDDDNDSDLLEGDDAIINGKLIINKYFPELMEVLFENEKTNKVHLKKGGKMNVIPEGALHARKNHLTDVDDMYKAVTHKGIPVITIEDDGEIIQHAEVEHSEIIFTKEVTDMIEKYRKQGTDEAALACGKLLVKEILYNTDDRTGLINTVE